MSGRVRGTERDRRRRALGQNFLVDQGLVDRFISTLDIRSGELIVDLGAGTGALTLPMARAGAEVWAVEADPVFADRLTESVGHFATSGAVRVIKCDLRRLRLPRVQFRVVANPPFGMTTELLSLLLDRPASGPTRADLIVQREVARKHASSPPTALRTAAWAPWWEFELGVPIQRRAFRPQPSVDAQVLTIRRRDPPVLPDWLAPRFGELLRPAWNQHRPETKSDVSYPHTESESLR